MDGFSEEEIKAAREYLNRKARRAHPEGKYGRGKKWTPSETEQRDCCAGIRNPSHAFPFSLLTHCRSVEHVANLHGIDVKRLRKAARALEMQDGLETREAA